LQFIIRIGSSSVGAAYSVLNFPMMSLLTELYLFVTVIYKDASPTGLKKSAFHLWLEIAVFHSASHRRAGAFWRAAEGLAHSKTLRVCRVAPHFRQVLECGSPLPLFPGTSVQSVFIRVYPWLKIHSLAIVHHKSGLTSAATDFDHAPPMCPGFFTRCLSLVCLSVRLP
jgi:hypothetical protein